MAFESNVTQVTDQGNAQPCYRLAWRDTMGGGLPTYAARNFGMKDAAVVEFLCDWRSAQGANGYHQVAWGLFRDADGSGIAVMLDGLGSGTWTLSIGLADTWAKYGSMTASVAVAGLALNTWFRMHIKAVVNADGTTTVTATARTTADVVLGTLTDTVTTGRGDYAGFYGTGGQPGSTVYAWYDNIHVTGSGSTNYQANNVATSYVYTFVNDIGEESAPSPASATILRPDGVAVTVTMPATTPVVGDAALYGITTKRLYRAVTGALGTVYVLVVADLPLATTTYVDVLDDSAIAGNDVLESEEWDLPPADLEGILALPNGIMAGFRRNQLCLSAAGRPHAWPVNYRLPVDTDIVAIANLDNTVVIGTKSFLYTATGNAPDSYSMSKPGDPQACVAKRSMLFLPDVGVVYASPDGLMVCAGSAGNVRNATAEIFTKRQWAALTPASIIAAVHDGVLHFFSTGQTPDSGYALDTKPTGFGLIRLSYHATAVHSDPLTDALYLVLDVNSEPTDADLPLASTAVVPSGVQIYQFDAGASDMVFRWRGRLNLAPYPLALAIAQVRALNYANLLVRVYGNGTLLFEKVLANAREFVLPAFAAYDSYELELMGTSTTRTVQAAEDVMELG